MVSVQAVYRTLQDLANKDQKGFITPAVFNRFAALAQLNIYNELFQELVKAKQALRQNVDPGRDKSIRKQTLEDLAFFVVRDYLISASSTSNLYIKPSNLSKIISISSTSNVFDDNNYDSTTNRYNRKSVELVYDVDKIDHILSSNLSTPTEDFPVALIAEDIEIFPTSISDITLTYYRRPGSVNLDGESTNSPPTYGEIFMNGMSMYNPDTTLNFMLPSHYDTELVMEIGKLIGVRLRDPNLAQFAATEEASE